MIIRYTGNRRQHGEHPFIRWCADEGIDLIYDPYGEPDLKTLSQDQAFAVKMRWL